MSEWLVESSMRYSCEKKRHNVLLATSLYVMRWWDPIHQTTNHQQVKTRRIIEVGMSQQFLKTSLCPPWKKMDLFKGLSHPILEILLVFMRGWTIYVIYLEPNWPLVLKVNPPKQGLFQPKQRVIWVPDIYTNRYMDSWRIIISHLTRLTFLTWQDGFPLWVGTHTMTGVKIQVLLQHLLDFFLYRREKKGWKFHSFNSTP